MFSPDFDDFDPADDLDEMCPETDGQGPHEFENDIYGAECVRCGAQIDPMELAPILPDLPHVHYGPPLPVVPDAEQPF